jgi:predicted permease
MLAYGIGALVVVFAVQIGTNTLSALADAPRLSQGASRTLLNVFALLPLPSSGATLVTELTLRTHGIVGPATTVKLAAVGTVLYGGVTLLLATAARRRLGGADLPAVSSRERQAPSTPIRLSVRSPRSAFTRQIFQSATRDTQVLMSLIMPLMLPTLATIGPVFSGTPANVVSFLTPGFAAIMSGWMLIHGLTRLEIGSGQLAASLPVVERDRVVPRMIIAAVVPSLGAAIAILIFQPFGSSEQIRSILFSMVSAVAVPAGFLMKVVLFGRVRKGGGEFVIEEVRPDGRFPKWVAVVGSMVIVAALLMVAGAALQTRLQAWSFVTVYVSLLVVCGAAEAGITTRLFPR